MVVPIMCTLLWLTQIRNARPTSLSCRHCLCGGSPPIELLPWSTEDQVQSARKHNERCAAWVATYIEHNCRRIMFLQPPTWLRRHIEREPFFLVGDNRGCAC